MPVSSKMTKRKAKAKKSELDKKKGLTTVIKPDGTRIDIPQVKPEKLSREDKFLLLWEEMLDDGLEIDESDIPEDLLDTWYAFQDEIKPQVAKKNWMLWSAIFVPLILPAFVQGVSGKVELPPDAKVPSVAMPAPKPEKVSDYAKAYFQEHGLELCKTMSQTDLKNLKEQLIANWGKGEGFFKKSFQEDYVDSKARLDTIYRTEYATAQNEGILARAKDAGHSFKVWNCALDERSCPVCSSMHGAIAPIEDVFPGTNWFRPQDSHPNCRCVMTTMKTEDIDQEGIMEDSAYLGEVASFIKLNYKCEFNGTDWKCPDTIPKDTNKEIRIDNPFEMRNKLSQYVNIDEVASFIKLNYKCKREDSPDGSNKCFDNKNNTEQITNKPINLDTSPTLIDFVTYERPIHVDANKDPYLLSLAKENGFDKLPKVVSKQNIDDLINNGYKELYRGVANKAFSDQLKTGEYFPGKGVSGNGIYTAYGENALHEASEYAKFRSADKKGNIIRMALHKDAKVITEDQVYDLIREEKTKILDEELKSSNNPEKLKFLTGKRMMIQDPGRYALSLGYDAIDVPSNKYMVILNRGALSIQDKDV